MTEVFLALVVAVAGGLIVEAVLRLIDRRRQS
jgi:hypothetical protein